MIKQIFQNITGITYFKAMKEIADERINNLTNILQRQRDFENLQNKLQEKNAEIRKIENTLEMTIDQQYLKIQKLKTQLEHARNNRIGKFYVFNPQADKPRKIYDSYEAALKDATSVSKICNGEKIFVLKIVAGIQTSEKFEDYSIDAEVPF